MHNDALRTAFLKSANGRAIAIRAIKIVKKTESELRIIKLIDEAYNMFVRRASFGCRHDFYNESLPVLRKFGASGGDQYKDLFNKIELASKYKSAKTPAERRASVEAYNTILRTVLSAKTLENHYIEQSKRRAMRELQQYNPENH
jgi:hypothetical protein